MAETTKPAPRVTLDLPIEFKKNYAREADTGVLKNISITGAFLEKKGITFAPNEKIRLKFTLSGRERKISAYVVWVGDAGAGIKFMPFNNQDTQIVDDLIYFVSSKRDSRRNILDAIFGKVNGEDSEEAA